MNREFLGQQQGFDESKQGDLRQTGQKAMYYGVFYASSSGIPGQVVGMS
jgi:hypothetical protein